MGEFFLAMRGISCILTDSLHYVLPTDLVSAIGSSPFMVCAELALLGCAFGVIGLTASSLTTHEGIADIASPSTDTDTRRSEVCSELARTYHLTEREAVILEYLSMGYTMQRIAELQYISQNTVRSHTKGLYRKLDCHSKQEVIEMVSREMKSQA